MDLKRIIDSETVLTELMVPSYSNFGGKVHGGVLLGLMDKIAYACATQHSSSYCVTVSVEGVEFLHPVEVGDLLTLKASVNYTGNTSMIIGMRVETKNPLTGQINHTNSCYFTMIAKDENGNKKSVPGLIIENEVQLRRFYEGMYLKQLAMEKRKILKSDFSHISLDELRQNCSKEKCSILI